MPPKNAIAELERCVKMGFVGCNLNPDPSGGYFNSPPMTDKWWYPFYEKMVELDVPAMIHVSGCCNPAQHTTGSYYLNADTMVFMQVILSDLFKDFPKLKFIIPHGGGAVPFHWGRFRGIALEQRQARAGRDHGQQHLLRHLRLSSAGHRPAHQGGAGRQHPVRLGDGRRGQGQRPARPASASTTPSAMSTRRRLSAADKAKMFEGNAYKVYSRLKAQIAKQAA